MTREQEPPWAGPGHRVPFRGQGHPSGRAFLQDFHTGRWEGPRWVQTAGKPCPPRAVHPLPGWEPACRPWTSSLPLNWSRIPPCWLGGQEAVPRSR